MNALELIKRIKWLSGGDNERYSYNDACNDMIDVIKQMEQEKWEKALIDLDQWSADGII